MQVFDLLKKAVDKWGEGPQILMAIEETSELTTELCHYLRDRGNLDKISEEMADVELMLDQLKYIFNNVGEIEQWKIKKYHRLRKRLEK